MGPQKQTYASPVTWVLESLNGTNVDSGKAFILSNSGREFSFLKLSTGVGSAFVSLYDGNALSDIAPGKRKWVMDAGIQAPDFNSFSNPLAFKKGVIAVLEEGVGANPIISAAIVGDLPA